MSICNRTSSQGIINCTRVTTFPLFKWKVVSINASVSIFDVHSPKC